MKIICISQYDNYFQKIKELVEPHNKKYCSKYNIDYKIVKIESCKNKIEGYWQKIILLNKILHNEEYNWIFLLDIDAVILDINFDIRNIIHMSKNNADIIICHTDCDPRERYWNINIGSMLVKNSAYTKEIVSDLIHQAISSNYTIYEQVVLQNMLKRNHKNILDKTEIFPCNSFNHEGKFIFHACNVSSTHGSFLDQIIKKEEVLRNKLI